MVIHSTVYTALWRVTSYFIVDTQHNIQETGGDRNEKKISLYFHNIYSLGFQETQPVDYTVSKSL